MAAILLLAVTTFSVRFGYAQGDSHTFPETGKTVKGSFLAYWTNHGGLAQQGYPVSDEVQQVSATDGKTYTVQYFERAVFEEHPEFAGTSNEVLLSLLGVFRYSQKYPNGAPAQSANNEANSQLFTATNHRVGGKFLDYWTSHGGLAQQGYPVSEEFMEVSDLDSKTYKVQYFERAVFEEHPEFAGTPNEVLLSQLGTFAWQAKQVPPTATAAPIPPTSTPAPVLPTNTPVPAQPTNTPVPQGPCSDVPASTANIIIAPSNCAKGGTTFSFIARGFRPGEKAGVYFTGPDQHVYGAPFQVDVDGNGVTDAVGLRTDASFPVGIWAISFEGTTSHHKEIGYFKIIP